MILAYSELAREIYGVTPDLLRNDLQQLLRTKVTDDKITLLRALAKQGSATVSELLRASKRNNTGGSYLAMRRFFDELVTLRVLERSKPGRRTLYAFPAGSSLAKWLCAGE